jgi:hypothetical protein
MHTGLHTFAMWPAKVVANIHASLVAYLEYLLSLSAKDQQRCLGFGKVLRACVDHSIVGTQLDPHEILDVGKAPAFHH